MPANTIETASEMSAVSVALAPQAIGELKDAQPTVVPKGHTQFKLAATREGWPDTGENIIECKGEISFDGGKTWELIIAFTALGDKPVPPEGMLLPEGFDITVSSVTTPLSQPEHPNRLIRTTTNILHPITTEVTFNTK